MYIKGYVHITEDEAFLANVHIVDDLRFTGGQYVGTMYLDNGEYVDVKEIAGCYHGEICKWEVA